MKNIINRIIKKSQLLSYVKLLLFRFVWKRTNVNNFTIPKNCFNRHKVKVGKYTYGQLDIRHFGNDKEELEIGDFCSIGPDCVFILGGEHSLNLLSTYPVKTLLLEEGNESKTKGKIRIANDVWLGYGVTVLSGVCIGQGAVVAAKSVVVKDVPPYAIVGGNPAKVIRYRFSQDIIDKIMSSNMYDNISDSFARTILCKKIDDNNIDDILNQL